MTTKEAVIKHMEIETATQYVSVSNAALYYAKLIVSYVFEGQRFTKYSGDFGLGGYAKLDIPDEAQDVVVQCEANNFGTWITIFKIEYAKPETHCFRVWGLCFAPLWEEIKC